MSRLAKILEEPEEVASINQGLERMCRVTLAEDFPAIILRWHKGERTLRGTKQTLHPGKSAVMQLAKAEHYFGPFSLLERIEREKDDDKRSKLIKEYTRWRDNAVMMWGGYPLSARAHIDGEGPLGPARFPDVCVVIIEADGSESEPMRLRDEYELGDWYYVDTNKRVNVNAPPKNDEYLALIREQGVTIRELQAQLVEIRGSLAPASKKAGAVRDALEKSEA